jgi:VWFA-related protein
MRWKKGLSGLCSLGMAVILSADSNLRLKDTIRQQDIEHDVTVAVKLIQTYVMDENGRPVTDLERNDFIVYDNGRRQEVTEFEKHMRTLKPAQREKGRLKTSAEVGPGPSSQLSRKFFFLFDLDRIDLEGFRESKDAALHFLDTQVQPGDEVGIFTYSGLRGLIMYEFLNDNHSKVQRILSGLKEVIGRPGSGAVFRDRSRRGSATAGSGREIAGVLMPQRSPEMDWREKLDMEFVKQMEDLAKGLRYVPGYKHIILFSHGFPRSLYEGDSFFQRNYDRMAQEFATANSPVHTINSEGRRQYAKSIGARGDSTLKNLSQYSGGRHFHNVRQRESIAEDLQALTSNFYVLGYYVDEVWDGKYHEIKVEVKRPGCRVLAQGGYFNPKPFKKFTRFEKRLHLFDLAMSDTPTFQDPTRFPLTALNFAPSGINLVLIADIERQPAEEVLGPETELASLIYDESHHIHASSQIRFDLDELEDDRFFHYSIASLPPGFYHCRMVMRNLETGKSAVGAAEVRIPEARSSGIRLFPPLMLAPQQKAPFLRKKRNETWMEATAGLRDIYAFLSEETAPLGPVWKMGHPSVLAVVRCDVTGINQPDTAISARMTGSEEGAVPISSEIMKIKRTGATIIFLIGLQIPDLAPGSYTLEILAEERTTQTRSSTQTSVTIRYSAGEKALMRAAGPGEPKRDGKRSFSIPKSTILMWRVRGAGLTYPSGPLH